MLVSVLQHWTLKHSELSISRFILRRSTPAMDVLVFSKGCRWHLFGENKKIIKSKEEVIMWKNTRQFWVDALRLDSWGPDNLWSHRSWIDSQLLEGRRPGNLKGSSYWLHPLHTLCKPGLAFHSMRNWCRRGQDHHQWTLLYLGLTRQRFFWQLCVL